MQDLPSSSRECVATVERLDTWLDIAEKEITEMVVEDTTSEVEDMEEAEEDLMEEDSEDFPTQEEETMDSRELEGSASIAVLVDTKKPIVGRRKQRKKGQIKPLKER